MSKATSPGKVGFPVLSTAPMLDLVARATQACQSPASRNTYSMDLDHAFMTAPLYDSLATTIDSEEVTYMIPDDCMAGVNLDSLWINRPNAPATAL